MELKEVESKIKHLEAYIDRLEIALALTGICYKCGEKITPKPLEDGLKWECNCGLYLFISSRTINKIKEGQKR